MLILVNLVVKNYFVLKLKKEEGISNILSSKTLFKILR